MAKFDVLRQREGGCYVLDCQADLLSNLNTRLVVPLLPVAEAPLPAIRLNPILDVEGEQLVMVTQFAAAMPVRELGEIVQSMLSQQDVISAALDMLIVGF
ncbi:CcdB family protein [Sphingobium sp. DC-2]|uniref:CcdB family protein n=1 Tax=Sphingobium sp. DC-2 TaxID=1303256 RepID=UPI0004C2BF95|nr:CcdB family protein [Sphingobium sp. DC-2]